MTQSENHPGWRSRKSGTKSPDIGGPFITQKKYVSGNPGQCTLSRDRNIPPSKVITHARYTGMVLPINPADALVTFPNATDSSESLLGSLGTSAIARVKPTNTLANVSTTLAELLREGLPKAIGMTLLRSKVKGAHKKAASEFLGVEFGWKPIINDVTDFVDAVRRSDAVLAQYERDSGRVVRRRYSFPTEETFSASVIRTGVRPFMPSTSSILQDGTLSSGYVVRSDKITKRRWFSGAFTYYLPRDYYARDKVSGYAKRANKLYGTSITPEVLWNVAPWSWAMDWVTNTGDVISNLSDWANDGLVVWYGYIMEHTRHERTFTYGGPTGYLQTVHPGTLTLVTETKKRVPATPFGFGITWESFSTRQSAILAALGISRRK